MINLNITAETPVELKKTLIDLARSLDTVTFERHEETFEASVESAPAPKQEAPAEESQDFQPDTPVPVDAPALPSMEEARAALNALRQKKGAAAVREILKSHGVSSFTELDPNDYPQVMKEAAVDG